MSRSVDNINLVIFPITSSRSRSDGDAAFSLLLHPVHRGRTLMHFTDFVSDAGIKQNTLGGGCFSRVNVSDDSDVS